LRRVHDAALDALEIRVAPEPARGDLVGGGVA
jgi:hypothetical protein